jgi:hypothetical protein
MRPCWPKKKAATLRIAAFSVRSADQKEAVIEPTTPALLILWPAGE